MEIRLWETSTGTSPVAEFIENQEPKTRAKIVRNVKHLEDQGMALLLSDKVEKMRGHDGLYELRTRYNGMIYRILFTTFDSMIWFLHAFVKKTQKTPSGEITIAMQRRREVIRQ